MAALGAVHSRMKSLGLALIEQWQVQAGFAQWDHNMIREKIRAVWNAQYTFGIAEQGAKSGLYNCEEEPSCNACEEDYEEIRTVKAEKE